MTYGQGVYRLAELLNLPAESTATASTTREGVQLRRALHEAILALKEEPFDWNTKFVDHAVAANTDRLTLSTAPLLPTGVVTPIFLSDKDEESEIFRVNFEDIARRRVFEPSQTGTVVMYCWVSDGLELWPKNTASWTLRGLWVKDQSLTEPTYSGTAWTFASDASTTDWLEEKKGASITLKKAAAWYVRTVYSDEGRAQLLENEVEDLMRQQHKITAKRATRKEVLPHMPWSLTRAGGLRRGQNRTPYEEWPE